jgi:hypothetical protein
MPDPTLPQYYGNDLASPGVQQPTGSFNLDAFGLAQAQLTFAFDSSVLVDIIDTYQTGVDYPVDAETLGFRMRSYKYSITSGSGDVSMLKVDYMGVARDAGWTDAQITGVATTTAQPIETHPAFSHDVTTEDDPPITYPAFGGVPGAPLNDAIFVPAPPQPNGALQFSFGGFGVAQGGTPNKKAGIRQFLRPMLNVRGQIFFNAENAFRSATMVQNIGMTLFDSADMNILIVPGDAVGALSPEICLLTNASVEPIGYPGEDGTLIAGIKVVYDIMVGGNNGWDSDIYWPAKTSIFA